MLPPRLLMIHDTGRGGQNDVAELTGRQQLDDPLLHVAKLDVVSRRDDTGLVQSAIELDDNLAIAVIIDFFVLADVALNSVSRCFDECRDRLNMASK